MGSSPVEITLAVQPPVTESACYGVACCYCCQGCVAGRPAAAGAYSTLCAAVLHAWTPGAAEPPCHQGCGALAAQGRPRHSFKRHVELSSRVLLLSTVCGMQQRRWHSRGKYVVVAGRDRLCCNQGACLILSGIDGQGYTSVRAVSSCGRSASCLAVGEEGASSRSGLQIAGSDGDCDRVARLLCAFLLQDCAPCTWDCS